MKKFKISIIAVFAMAMAIATSAFTNMKVHPPKGSLTVSWFKYTGDPTNLTQLQTNTMYDNESVEPCDGEDLICAVHYTALSSGLHPAVFDAAFKSRIAAVKNGGTDADIAQEDE